MSKERVLSWSWKFWKMQKIFFFIVVASLKSRDRIRWITSTLISMTRVKSFDALAKEWTTQIIIHLQREKEKKTPKTHWKFIQLFSKVLFNFSHRFPFFSFHSITHNYMPKWTLSSLNKWQWKIRRLFKSPRQNDDDDDESVSTNPKHYYEIFSIVLSLADCVHSRLGIKWARV